MTPPAVMLLTAIAAGILLFRAGSPVKAQPQATRPDTTGGCINPLREGGLPRIGHLASRKIPDAAVSAGLEFGWGFWAGEHT